MYYKAEYKQWRSEPPIVFENFLRHDLRRDVRGNVTTQTVGSLNADLPKTTVNKITLFPYHLDYNGYTEQTDYIMQTDQSTIYITKFYIVRFENKIEIQA